MTVEVKYDRDDLLTDYAVGMLKDFYMVEGEDSPQDAYARASTAWSMYKGQLDEVLARRLYEYVSKKWFMFASPVLSNAPSAEGKGKGLPISCFLTYVPDTLEGLIEHSSELRWLSVMGGGVGGHWSDVRTVSDIAPGPIPFLHTVDADMIAYRQGKTRKGSYAAYLDISHPDIIEFLNIRIPTGDVQRKALNIHNAINISDEFMTAVINNKKFDLRDPKDGAVKDSVDARKLWERILEVRFRTGEPYLNFIDRANEFLPQPLKDKGLKILMIFEGRDAAGKGSTIKRFNEYLNPRLAQIVALPAPTEREVGEWYFQKYVRHLPTKGEIRFFDRSWYNRAGVEKVMGYCTPDEYRRFLHQAPIFERMLIEDGIILRKYWFSISDAEQTRRFESRLKDPMRRWKFSPTDMESVTKWEEYSKAKDEMFVHTDTPESPWFVVEAEDKRIARLNTIHHFLSTWLYSCVILIDHLLLLVPHLSLSLLYRVSRLIHASYPRLKRVLSQILICQ